MRDFYPTCTPSPRFYAIDAIQQNILLPRPYVLKLEVFALRASRAAGPAAVANSRLLLNLLLRVAAASRGSGTLASVRRRRPPFKIKGPLLMLHHLHHLWCAATLAEGVVCPTSELRRALNTESLTVVATRSAWPATGGAAGARPPEDNDSKRLRSAVNQRSSESATRDPGYAGDQ